MGYINNEIHKFCLELWQQDLDNGDTGRTTYRFIPHIGKHLNSEYFQPDFYTTQLLTGHGKFRTYLHRFGHDIEEMCNCDSQEPQDPFHLLFNCDLFNADRDNLIRTTLLAGHNWPCKPNQLLDNKDLFLALKRFLSSTSALQVDHHLLHNHHPE